MRNEILDRMIALRESETPYAHASIVRRTAPTSGKPGDHALITEDGQIFGWIGGGCTRGIVLKEALLSLQDHKPRLVSISKSQDNLSSPNTKSYRMTCQSGGAVEVYIEPMIPKPQILIFGNSHIGHAICKLAKVMDYKVVVALSAMDSGTYTEADKVMALTNLEDANQYSNAYVIVCSQGDGDIPALLKAIETESEYIGFVASRMKAQSVFMDLRKHSITVDQLKKIKTPAGIDIGGKSPEEVAISILAEIIQMFRTKSDDKSKGDVLANMPNDAFYINPVCKIPIEKATAKHVIQFKGESVYFCCDGCKVSFEKAPEQYLNADA